MAYAEAGWPDVSLGFQHGMSDKLDIGAKLSLTYGVAGTTFTGVGMGVSAPIRIGFLKSDKLSALIHVDPGVRFMTFSGPLFGLQVPVGVEFGIHLTPEATVGLGFDLPFYLNFTNGVFAVIPPLAGAGFEYHVSDQISVGLNTRFGVAIFAGGLGGFGFAGTGFSFLTQGFFAYRL